MNKEHQSFIALDFETANSKRTSACQIGLALFENGKMVWKKSYLIKPFPNFYEPINTRIHGINQTMTDNCPTFGELWPEIKLYIEDKFLVAHNASFDISVLNRTLEVYGINLKSITYECSLLTAKSKLIGIRNYQLPTLCEHFGIELIHHDAESDAVACGELIIRLWAITSVDKIDNVNEFEKNRSYKKNNYLNFDVHARTEIIHGHPFEGKVIVFTGSFESYTRMDLIQSVTDVGGVCKSDSLTQTTNYLVVAKKDFNGKVNQNTSSKILKALEFIKKGINLEIINEDEFIEILGSVPVFEITIDKIIKDKEQLFARNKYNEFSTKDIFISSDVDNRFYQLMGDCGSIPTNEISNSNIEFAIISKQEVELLESSRKSNNILKIETAINKSRQSMLGNLKIYDDESILEYLDLRLKTQEKLFTMNIYEWQIEPELRFKTLNIDK